MKSPVWFVWPLILGASMGPGFGQTNQPLGSVEVLQLRREIRGNFFVPDPLPPLDARTYRVFSPAVGVKAEAVTYATQLGVRVPAILYWPDSVAGGKDSGVCRCERPRQRQV